MLGPRSYNIVLAFIDIGRIFQVFSRLLALAGFKIKYLWAVPANTKIYTHTHIQKFFFFANTANSA